jgi:hypothetical protein
LTVDVNCEVVPIVTEADVGLMVTTSAIVTTAVAFELASATLTAEIVTLLDAGTEAGAK